MGENSALSEIESIVGPEAMAEIRRRLAGEQIYIPRRADLDSTVICAEFNTMMHEGSTCGNAYQRIADKHEVSTRTVMRIIAGA